MSQKSTQHEELIKAMDNIYESLIEEAQRLAAAYFEEASVDPSGTKRHVVLLIQVRRLTDQSWCIHWAKNVAAPGKPAILRTINKGNGPRYPVGTFSSVKEPLKALCRAYERRLTKIRAACFQNRALRRSLEAHVRQAEQALTPHFDY